MDFKIIIQECCLVTLYHNCSNHFALLNKMAAGAKNRKPLNDSFSWTSGWILIKLYRNVSWVTVYQNCSNASAKLNKMAARALNRNKLLTTSAKSVERFWNNLTGMSLRWLSTKIAQTVPLCWIKWLPELKIEKPLNDFSLPVYRFCNNYTGMFLG